MPRPLGPVLLLLVASLVLWPLEPVDASTTTTATSRTDHLVGQLLRHARLFADGFGNATELLRGPSDYDDDDDEAIMIEPAGEGRGRRRKMKQMNRTLMAIVMAFSFKFMFLIPSFVGTLILLKFTAALAGFFYALFAAVLGLERHQH